MFLTQNTQLTHIMISTVLITNLKEAERHSFRSLPQEQDLWISVVGEEDRNSIRRMSKNFREKNVKFFHQFFADWSDDDGLQWEHLKQTAPQLRHVQNIISFLKPYTTDLKSHKLGVNCFAGISRSTAVGLIALVMSGRTIEQALTEILKNRPEAWPNLRILGFASEILETDLKSHVEAWKKNCSEASDIFLMPDREQSH